MMALRTASMRNWNVFDAFLKYHMKILLRDFNAKYAEKVFSN
jgi:hypothetical protein